MYICAVYGHSQRKIMYISFVYMIIFFSHVFFYFYFPSFHLDIVEWNYVSLFGTNKLDIPSLRVFTFLYVPDFCSFM